MALTTGIQLFAPGIQPPADIHTTGSSIDSNTPSAGKSRGDEDGASRVTISRKAQQLRHEYERKEEKIEQQHKAEKKQLEQKYQLAKQRLEREYRQEKQSLELNVYA